MTQKQLSNRIPALARRSRLGVWLTRLPYALIACVAWSSLMMNRMLGRMAAPLLRGTARETKAVQIISVQFFMAGIVRETSNGAIAKIQRAAIIYGCWARGRAHPAKGLLHRR